MRVDRHSQHDRFVAATIFELGYGRTIKGGDDDFIRLVEKGVSQALSGTGTAAGNSLVDYFPIREQTAAASV